MYPIDPATLAVIAHPAAREQLRRIIPDHVKLLKLPMPDSDRDMAAMRMESAAEAVRAQTALLDRMRPRSEDEGRTYLDPVTGGVFYRKNVEYALQRASETLFWLRVQLMLNDSWRAAEITAAPQPSTQADLDEANRLEGPLVVRGLEPLPELKEAKVKGRGDEE